MSPTTCSIDRYAVTPSTSQLWRNLRVGRNVVGRLAVVGALGEPPPDCLAVGGRVVAVPALETEPEQRDKFLDKDVWKGDEN